ncbi:MAG: hypothetical protein RLZZ58_805 [Pseudomonadota bacterium]
MTVERRHDRLTTRIPVTISSVLDSVYGVITDLSEGGARIEGATLPEKSRCQIEYGGQTVYGTVMWAEVDRMGIRFPFELADGPLYDALEMARAGISAEPLIAPGASVASTFGRRLS